MNNQVSWSLKTKISLSLTVFLWASAFVGIRLGLTGYSPGSLALFRYIIASICMVFFYFRVPKRQKITLNHLLSLLFLGVIGIGIYNVALNYAEVTISAAIASFIVSQMPVFTAIFAVLFLGEKLDLRSCLGILVSFLGVVLIAFGSSKTLTINIGIFYALIAALMGSTYTVLQKPLLGKFHPFELSSFAIWGGTLVMTVFFPQLIEEIPQASLTSTLSVVYLGIFPAAIAYAAWSVVLSKTPASGAAVCLYSMPIIATILGWIVLGEIPYFLALIGGLLALIGALIVSLRKNRL